MQSNPVQAWRLFNPPERQLGISVKDARAAAARSASVSGSYFFTIRLFPSGP
jgi:hypothetical protein